MSLTKEQVERIPDVYRDFLLALIPVVESRRQDAAIKISGVPMSRVYWVINETHGFSLPQVRELANNLLGKGYIEEDQFGFFSPTALGEDVIRTLVPTSMVPAVVPDLPDLN